MTRRQRLGILERELAKSSARVNFDKDSVDGFINSGQMAVEEVLSADALEIVTNSCRRLLSSKRLLPYSRKLEDEYYHKISRATLFRNAVGPVESLHSMAVHAPELVRLAIWSDNRIRMLCSKLVLLGLEEPALILGGHQSQRAVLNAMHGTPTDIATIGVHVDPIEEKGANASFTLGDGIDLVSGLSVPANTLNIYACQDLSDALGLKGRPPHGFSSDSERMSLVYTRFVEST